MRKLKLLLSTIFVIALLVIMYGSGVYATTGDKMTLNITDTRPYTNSKYTVETGRTPNNVVNSIFKVGKRNGATLDFSDSLYCLRSGIGFGNTAGINNITDVQDVVYTETYNLKTDATNVINHFTTKMNYADIDRDNSYNAILWIVDNMYLPEHSDAASMKASLINKVLKYDGGVNVARTQLEDLTDDDIEFVEQMALWYFANYDTNGQGTSLSLADTVALSNATEINELSLSEGKQKAVDALYKFFIENAKANASNYGLGSTRQVAAVKPEINVNSNSKTVTADNTFTVVGPFSITETSGNLDFDYELIVKDKQGAIIPEKDGTTPIIYIVENPTDMVPYKDSLKDTVGQGNFYLKIANILAAQYDLSDLTIESNCTYEKQYNTIATLWLADADDTQPILKVEKEEIIEGEFEVVVEKRDENGNLLFGAEFTMITEDRQVITITNNGDGTFNCEPIKITELNQEFIFDLEEISAPSGYIGINGAIKVKVTTKLSNDGKKYVIDQVTFINAAEQPITIDGVTFDIVNNNLVIKVENKKIKVFDLALRKYITQVNGVDITDTKVPNIDTTKLDDENDPATTAEYKHRKDPVEVKTNDLVTYKISVYNEGDVDGLVTEILDYLPEGLDFDPLDNPTLIEKKNSYTASELVGKEYAYEYDSTQRLIKISPINSAYLFKLDAYNGSNLDNSNSIEIVCKVAAEKESKDIILTNIATMKYKPANTEDSALTDIDSSEDNLNLPTDWPNYNGDNNNKPYRPGDSNYFYKGQEDDDDYDKVIIYGVPFDLSLRKFITKVNGKDVTSRIPQVDTSKLNTIDPVTGKKITTATYTHSKEPVIVKKGDIVTYTIRIYNEGELDGYASKVADYIPEGLGYILNYKTNTDNDWHVDIDENTKTVDLVGINGLYNNESAIKNLSKDDFYVINSLSDVKIVEGKAKITSTSLEEEKIKAYNPALTSSDISSTETWQQSTNGTDGLFYKDVEITCIVLAENTYAGTLRNIAEVEEDKAVDENDNEIQVEDRDSVPDDVDTGNYNPGPDNSTYQEDDDDYEPLQLRYFDLALRKFITAVNEEEITTRIPDPTVNNNGELEYIHDKTPIYVSNSDIVTYTIRVYNEGTVLGYAMEISDDIPDGLVFLPEHEINKQYKWVMIDSNGDETTDPEQAVEIRTKYLENSLLKPFDPMKEISTVDPFNPDCAEVKVAFRVVESNITQENRIITNKAQITEDKAVDEDGNEIDIPDEDSIPDEWNPGEDDQDVEHIYVRKFDLALLKWVSKTIVTVDGKTTTTDTGFTPYDDPEPIAKVVIDKKKINKTTVKFVYSIIIINQGEIAGYATEITDYIPAGLEFVAADNPLWTKEGDNKITTRALEGTLLQPGQSAIVQVTFTWKNGANNLGVKTNIAEISEDYNDKGSEDIDSTPDNVKTPEYDKQQEDDDDKALVMLELKTGGVVTSYMWLALVVLAILTSGITLIKKYVI